ncbi:undecaprenyl-diphosphatase [Desulforamulus aeronauticus]|uniref:Undecaprenyl-diphosphatase n=1 Tax=Desulforamulus aeronauticus DSM 10349 TaxID=1121421 RepID=A0A1M6NF01_9FIRM|nr:undecaprenyl-diphosphatase [Desulforamulus aeronauticus]SHJ94321.1 undecaprenyl-diphosphatase [Desulforamulus aeronauticus DSM 10349]
MNYQLFKAINDLAGEYPILDGFMVFVSQKSIFFYALILILMWFRNERYMRIVIYAAITGCLGLFINFVITQIYFEPRPFVAHSVHLLIKHAADASFPSNHTTGAFALALGVFIRQHKIGSRLLFVAILTGISRIFVGHHYPFDVLGSVIVAGLASLLVYKASPLLEPIISFIIQTYYRMPFLAKHKTVQKDK